MLQETTVKYCSLRVLNDDVLTNIAKHIAALYIQSAAIKMFYKKYGCNWFVFVQNYQKIFDYYCYLNDINDPYYDYYELYR